MWLSVLGSVIFRKQNASRQMLGISFCTDWPEIRVCHPEIGHRIHATWDSPSDTLPLPNDVTAHAGSAGHSMGTVRKVPCKGQTAQAHESEKVTRVHW